ncbi:MAG TPA: 23S rRNA (guanosine(2251)-2'-O)-methyltransferase RlmB [Azospirillaceae bacterium]|nr:23S rRNA (guanosine(2251)-2'-O)-methyltransferase RlmB [Azospirillaceae bacterium]
MKPHSGRTGRADAAGSGRSPHPGKPQRKPPAKSLSPHGAQRPQKPQAQPQDRQKAPPEQRPPRGSLLFGVHAVSAALRNPSRNCRRLWATDMAAVGEALADAAARGLSRPAPMIVEKAMIDRLVSGGTVHQGVLLEADPLPEPDLSDLLTNPAADAVLVVLDQVTDPHNVGAVLRSAAAFGAAGLVVTERHAPEVTGTLAKSASGALEVVPLVRVGNLARAIAEMREAGFWCVGLSERAERPLHEHDLSGRTALVLGSEGTGIRRLTAERCDALARLPTQGPIESLNVSVAAAISLYETARRRS